MSADMEHGESSWEVLKWIPMRLNAHLSQRLVIASCLENLDNRSWLNCLSCDSRTRKQPALADERCMSSLRSCGWQRRYSPACVGCHPKWGIPAEWLCVYCWVVVSSTWGTRVRVEPEKQSILGKGTVHSCQRVLCFWRTCKYTHKREPNFQCLS